MTGYCDFGCLWIKTYESHKRLISEIHVLQQPFGSLAGNFFRSTLDQISSFKFTNKISMCGVNLVPEHLLFDLAKPRLHLGPHFETEPRPLQKYEDRSSTRIRHGQFISGEVFRLLQIFVLEDFQVSRYLAKTFFYDHFVGALGGERVALQELGKHVSVANWPARSCKILISFLWKKGGGNSFEKNEHIKIDFSGLSVFLGTVIEE